MRLLHSTKLELAEFFGDSIPQYAILSHTWEDEEVTFQVIGLPQRESMQGFAKIRSCCARAARDGFDWVWIDTCCIDKSSSSELSEAINSMYAWYRDSAICYAYFCDVAPTDPVGADPDAIRGAKWFTRGWCLQELIAPCQVEFYAFNWTEIGTKSSLRSLVSEITGIRSEILAGVQSPTSCNAAERMSWASTRKTSRIEDVAYCLLGLFDVHMPLLYGEGDRAFVRLQEIILDSTEDYSLFLWSPPAGYNQNIINGFCRSPECFSRKGLPIESFNGTFGSHPYWKLETLDIRIAPPLLRSLDSTEPLKLNIGPPVVTSRGIRMTMFMKPISEYQSLAWLNCWTADDEIICVRLRSHQPMVGMAPAVWRDPMSLVLTSIPAAEFGNLQPHEVYFTNKNSAPLRANSWRNTSDTRNLEIRLAGSTECELTLLMTHGDDESTSHHGHGAVYTLNDWHRKIAILLKASQSGPVPGTAYFVVVASFSWPSPWVHVFNDLTDTKARMSFPSYLKWASATDEPPTTDRVSIQLLSLYWVKVSVRQLPRKHIVEVAVVGVNKD